MKSFLFFWKRKKAPHLWTVDCHNFTEAFVHEGCPICFVLAEKEKNFIQHTFVESINDPYFRQKWRNAGGICDSHFNLLMKLCGKLELAILAQDLLSHWREQISSRKMQSRCFLCQIRNDMETQVINSFHNCLQISSFWKEMEKSSGFCHRHFFQCLSTVKSSQWKNHFIQWQEEKIRHTIQLIQNFVQKNDYRSQKQKILPQEAAAIRQAWILLKNP